MAEGGTSAHLRAQLESLMCASSEPLTLDKAAEVIEGVTRGDVARALADLQAEYERDGRGFRIVEVAGGYQLRTAPQYGEYVRRLLKGRPMRLTRPMLESLAIVAYKQPVTRAEVEAIRGVDVDSVLATLLDRGLIRVAGRKEAPGRPLIYATSREFLEVFGLRRLSELPTLREMGDLEMLSAPEIDLGKGRPPADDGEVPTDVPRAEEAAAGSPEPVEGGVSATMPRDEEPKPAQLTDRQPAPDTLDAEV
jgi:segregation and condensation protein B